MTFIQETLAELQANYGWSQASIERSLDIPQKTLSKEDPEPELIALMKIVRIYPWVVQVADRKYNEFDAIRVMGHAAVDIAAANKVANYNINKGDDCGHM